MRPDAGNSATDKTATDKTATDKTAKSGSKACDAETGNPETGNPETGNSLERDGQVVHGGEWVDSIDQAGEQSKAKADLCQSKASEQTAGVQLRSQTERGATMLEPQRQKVSLRTQMEGTLKPASLQAEDESDQMEGVNGRKPHSLAAKVRCRQAKRRALTLAAWATCLMSLSEVGNGSQGERGGVSVAQTSHLNDQDRS